MAFFVGNVFSRSLMMETQLSVSLPKDGRQYVERGATKTLVLLHGISDNASGWARHSQVDYFAEQYDVAVLMPEVQRSFYQDMELGLAYYRYVAEELPALAAKLFNLSTRREDMMVAGLSMGGYGALRVAFGNPQAFSMCGAFSSACDLRYMVEHVAEFSGQGEIGTRQDKEYAACFGSDYVIPDDSDLFSLVERVSRQEPKPRVYMSCGTEDFIRAQSLKFRDFCRTLPLDFTFEEWSGEHTWDFWNPSLRKMLEHFLVAK